MAEKKITFRAKQKLECPICDDSFHREELLSGGGRLNAGELSRELHRTYLPTEKYGAIYPLIYPVTVCPQCFNACYGKEFPKIPPETVARLKEETPNRKEQIRKLFPQVEFVDDRTLQEGIASYFLAMLCYEHYPTDQFPSFRQGLSALRAGWLCGEMHKKHPGDNWDYLSLVFLRKASYFYTRTIDMDQSGKEPSSQMAQFGPDIDQNYGFDGVVYLAGLLEFTYGQRNKPEIRAECLKRARSVISRIVGMGKTSKSKPGVLLDNARDLHKEIKTELEGLGVDA